MKYAVKFSLDTDGFTNWDEDQIEDPDITFSIVIYPSLEDAKKAVNQDFIDFRDDPGFYSNDTVRSCNGRWLVANDMKMFGGTAVPGIGEAYAVSYEVSGDCDYASMIIESVSPASEEDETHMESDLEEGYVEGVYICTASQPDTANGSPKRDNQSLYNTEGLRERLVKKVKDAIIKPTSHPEKYSEIDADAINRFDLEILRDLADNGDAEASYLLFQIYGSEEMLHDLLFDKYLEKAALGGFPAAIRPYIIRKEFYRFIDADEIIRWNKDLPFSFEDYNSYCAKYLQEFLDFCENTVNASPECAEACLELLNAYIREFWGNQWSCDDRVRELHKRDDVYETSEFGVLAMKLAQRISGLPEALLLPLKETYSEQLQKYTDKDSDPFLGGLSLDKCLENYPDLDYLYDRYGYEAIDRVYYSLDYPENYYDSITIKRFATVHKGFARLMELCASLGKDGFEKEDLFKAIYLQLNFGEEFTDTLSGDDFVGLENGYNEIEFIIDYYFFPEFLKKYGLEEITERIIKALNCEIADDFWNSVAIGEYPNFLNDLVPLLNEQIAKGSVDAANVLMKAFRAGKDSYFCDVTNFKVPEGVTNIGAETFAWCESLSNVVLPDGLEKIEYGAFLECPQLSSVIIPKGVKKIGELAYKACSNLKSVTLPIGVKTIAEDAFSECDSLQEILIPSKKTDYYKKRLPSELWDKIVELDNSKK